MNYNSSVTFCYVNSDIDRVWQQAMSISCLKRTDNSDSDSVAGFTVIRKALWSPSKDYLTVSCLVTCFKPSYKQILTKQTPIISFVRNLYMIFSARGHANFETYYEGNLAKYWKYVIASYNVVELSVICIICCLQIVSCCIASKDIVTHGYVRSCRYEVKLGQHEDKVYTKLQTLL
jgi:hypothetical protein